MRIRFTINAVSLAALLITAPRGLGQTFTNVIGTGLPQLSGSAAWGDYDNDGNLDLLLAGYNGSSNVCQVWHNNGNGTFSQKTTLPGLPAPANSAVAWGDYDNDGNLDFALIGAIGATRVTQIWHNNGNGTFTQNTNAVIPGVAFGAVAWGDYDNDGKLDLALCGYNGTQYVCQLWHNNGDGTFTQNTNTAFPPLRDGAIAWGDYNNDGYKDLLLAGQSNGVAICQIWRNLGNNSFSNINAGLTGVWRATVAWGDYDNDGNLDVLLAGGTTNNPVSGGPTNPVCQVWHNQGNGTFTNLNVGLPGVMSGSVAWGDYDNDGKPDILVCGATNDATGAAVSQVWHNNGNGTFTPITLNLPGVYGGAFAWGDYDNDTKLDFFLMGYSTSLGGICQVWHNNNSAVDSLPDPPSGLGVVPPAAYSAVLYWTGADRGVADPGLSYSVRVGSRSGASDIVNPQADISVGFRRLPALANAGPRESLFLTNLAPATTYYWSVQGVDPAWQGGAFSSESSFTTAALLPNVVSATALNPGSTNITLQAAVNPGYATTGVQFVYGLDTNYGTSTPITITAGGHTNVTVTNLISYLFIGFTYHFAVVATNSAGSVTSQDYTFTLPGTPTASVSSTADSGPGSLRQAMIDVAAGGTINVSVSGMITLSNPLPAIFKSITINGPGATNLAINGNNLWRPFFVDAASGSVNINNLTLTNGRAKGGDGGGAYVGGGGGLGAGGALFINAGSVILSNVTFAGNSAAGGNGGSWSNAAVSAAGGGGLGGNGGSASGGSGGGGGFFGNGGSAITATGGLGGGGGGGGFIGNGGVGTEASGGGGGALTDGQSATTANGGTGGPGGTGEGGDGASDNLETAFANGGPGVDFGGGGGGGDGYDSGTGGWGGAGAKFGGGGGAYGNLGGGAGGDFGGGGGSEARPGYSTDPGGAGGFGGGGGGSYGYSAGTGGFGGGGGGSTGWNNRPGASGGPFGGVGGTGTNYSPLSEVVGAGGGGGAALGAAVFVRAINGAFLSVYNASVDAGSLTPGAGVAAQVMGPDVIGKPSGSGQVAGSSIFSLGGTNLLATPSGTNTIAGSIADWAGAPACFAKSGAGTLIFSGTNTYRGPTLVNAGTLMVNGNNGSSSNLYVAGGATIAGNGIVGPVTLNSGGTITPGIGMLTAGNSVWSGAGNYNWQLYDATNRAGVGYGMLQVNGTFNLSAAGGFGINVWTLSSPGANGPAINFNPSTSNSWTLVRTTGGIIGFNPTNFLIRTSPYNGTAGFANATSGQFSLAAVGNALVLSYAGTPTVVPPVLVGPALTNGTVQLSFTNVAGASFTMLATTNILTPLTNWTVLGPMTENPPGLYRFTDPQAATNRQRFYRVRSP